MKKQFDFKLKKSLGQHFLEDVSVAERIGKAAYPIAQGEVLLEVGPGSGALTDHMLAGNHEVVLVEIDGRLIKGLQEKYGERVRVVKGNFLEVSLQEMTEQPIVLVGNLPYYISGPFFFKVLREREQVSKVVCMVQDEVATRITAKEGSKKYGILSVLLGAFYERAYLFKVGREAFVPPPDVTSGVLRLVRNDRKTLGCDEQWFIKVVQQAFQQRRKMLRNALGPLGVSLEVLPEELLTQRAEQVSVEGFIDMACRLEKEKKTARQ